MFAFFHYIKYSINNITMIKKCHLPAHQSWRLKRIFVVSGTFFNTSPLRITF